MQHLVTLGLFPSTRRALCTCLARLTLMLKIGKVREREMKWTRPEPAALRNNTAKPRPSYLLWTVRSCSAAETLCLHCHNQLQIKNSWKATSVAVCRYQSERTVFFTSSFVFNPPFSTWSFGCWFSHFQQIRPIRGQSLLAAECSERIRAFSHQINKKSCC